MYVEDIITTMSIGLSMNPFDSKIIDSFAAQIYNDTGFTDKQMSLALKIISRQQLKIETLLGHSISSVITNPTFKLLKRTISNARSISITTDNEIGKAFKLVFPYTDEIVNIIRKSRDDLPYAQWDKQNSAWIFSADEQSLKFLLDLHKQYNFNLDETVEDYFTQANYILDHLEEYAPSVCYEDSKLIFKNTGKFIPQLETDDVLTALFTARKVGIQLWDSNVSQLLIDNKVGQYVLDFLDTPQNEKFVLNWQSHISEIVPVLSHMMPCLVIVPVDSELKIVEACVNIFKSIGIDTSDMGILFRLKNPAPFNDYVKDNNLNNPPSETSKVVFVSGKIPKTIIESGIEFNSTLNFTFNAHFTTREWVSFNPNVINVTSENLKGHDFANM